MFIDFEGIDGSGKTTLSNLLAARLKKLGYRVVHAREGGELQSPVARRVRELTRDARLLEMGARTEFFLNLARDAQQLEEVVAPALARGEVCITDRYLYSQLALSGGGRGLPGQELRAACELASQGLWPDLVVLVDVQPDLARLRKRLGKLGQQRGPDSDSRKGLVGAGLAVRTREAFLALARKDPARWLVLDNNDQPLWALEQRLVELVVARLEGRELPLQRLAPPTPPPPPARLAEVEARFWTTLDALEAREPQLGTWLLGGLPGLAAHQRRVEAVERFPHLVARSLAGLFDEPAWSLRELLAATHPADVLASLGASPDPRAHALRDRLYARAPHEALVGLKHDDGERAWDLRARGLADGHLGPVLTSLAGVDSEEAWGLRDKGVQARLWAEVARSLTGLGTPRADALRERLLGHDRLAVLRSTAGLSTPLACGLRETLFAKATKLVLRSLTGVDTPEAWALRVRGAPLTKEALDSVDAMDQEEAWRLRERYAARWPSTALSSLEGLPVSERAEALVLAVLEAEGARLPLLRATTAFLARARYGAHVVHPRPPRAAAASAHAAGEAS